MALSVVQRAHIRATVYGRERKSATGLNASKLTPSLLREKYHSYMLQS